MNVTQLAVALMRRRLFASVFCLGLWLTATPALLAIDDGDDFDDSSVDTNKWGSDIVIGSGVLTEMTERLEFTVAKGSKQDQSLRPWVLTQFPTTNDWEIQVNVFNASNLAKKKQVSSMGVVVHNWVDRFDSMFIEMYNSSLFDFPATRGFYSVVETDGEFQGDADSFNVFGSLAISNGALRVTFDSATQVLAAYYDTNPVDGFQWILMGTIGIAGSGAADLVTDWDMDETDRFSVLLYGYGEKAICTSGEVYADEFVSMGGAGYLIPPTRLTAAFDGVSESCKQGDSLVCKLKGKLIMTNGTTSPVDDTRVRVYISSNNTFEEGEDTLISTYQTGFRSAGKAKKLKIAATRDTDDAGLFLLAVADNGEVLASFQLPAAP